MISWFEDKLLILWGKTIKSITDREPYRKYEFNIILWLFVYILLIKYV